MISSSCSDFGGGSGGASAIGSMRAETWGVSGVSSEVTSEYKARLSKRESDSEADFVVRAAPDMNDVMSVPEASDCDSVSNCGCDCDKESRSASHDHACVGVADPVLGEPRALISRTSE